MAGDNAGPRAHPELSQRNAFDPPHAAPGTDLSWTGRGGCRGGGPRGGVCRRSQRQLKLSPQAHDPCALGLSIVKPCFSIVSTKSMVAPARYGALMRSVTTLSPS